MSQLDELAKGPWLKAEEVTRDGIYWMTHPGLRKPKLVDVFQGVDVKWEMRSVDTITSVTITDPYLFHGPLTPPPAP